MKCKICHEKRATPKHIQAHGLNYDEYIRAYEPETYELNETTKLINDLYITVRNKFGLMNHRGEMVTVSKGEKRRWPLCDSDIKDHLSGKKTLAVYFPGEKSKFISFDIDKPDKEVIERVYNTITHYIPRKSVLCSWSGSKGYHIDIFFDGLIEKAIIDKFYRVILSDTGYDERLVECRGHNNQAVKLPLGIHFRNNNLDTQYCYLCDEFGNPLSDALKALFSVRKADPNVLYDVVDINYSEGFFNDEEYIDVVDLIEEVRDLPVYNQTLDEKHRSIERLIDEGIAISGTRHQTMYKIALLQKDRGYSKEEIIKFLSKWFEDKCDPALYKSNYREVIQDIKDLVNCIFRHDYKLKVNARKIILSQLDLKEIISVKDKALRKLYFILYKHAKAYADKDGIFYMTYQQMKEAGAGNNNETFFKKQIDKLESYGKVTVVERGQRAEGKLKNAPNRYKINAFYPIMEIEIPSFEVCDLKCENCLEKACSYLLDKSIIKEAYSRDTSKIINLKGKCRNENNNKNRKAFGTI